MMNETGFSNSQFVQAVVSGNGGSSGMVPLQVIGSGPNRTMYGLETINRRGLKQISLAPLWLYASPGWEGELEKSTVRSILSQLRSFWTANFEWTVRFDQGELSRLLRDFRIPSEELSTHVLQLKDDYEKVFAGFNATTRRKIRRSQNTALEVIDVKDDESVAGFHSLYVKLQSSKGRKVLYSVKMFQALTRLPTSSLLVAKFEGEIVAGTLFFDDGRSVFYWQNANDRRYEKLFPSHAILDVAIKDACERQLDFFDFGASVGNPSLEAFKSFWGATKVPYWSFHWRNSYWNLVNRLESNVRRLRRLPQRIFGSHSNGH